ncbi:MAG: D-aminoacyl-tRNA deacylase [Syntrophorhabdales bacterium]|jgi:D-tyrosyl-tRNA(Tyr) deacylase
MRAVIQRVKEARVTVDGRVAGEIGSGLMVLVGIRKDDTDRDIDWMVEKIVNLRIFETGEGKLDRSLVDTGGALLLVSQFTLYGDCKKGRRPSFSDAMDADGARRMFEAFVEKARLKVGRVETGVFQAMMDVQLVNDGPVTLILDSRA